MPKPFEDHAVIVRPVLNERNEHREALFEVRFAGPGLVAGKTLTVEISVIADPLNPAHTSPHKDVPIRIGQIEGTLSSDAHAASPCFACDVTGAKNTLATSENTLCVGLVFGDIRARKLNAIYFALPLDRHEKGIPPEGDSWTIQLAAKADADPFHSPPFNVIWARPAVPTRFGVKRAATYDWHAGNAISFFHDACQDENGNGAFAEIEAAIKAATDFVFVVDWSFHPTIHLNPQKRLGAGPKLADTVGGLLLDRAEHGVLVAIHTWWHAGPVAEQANEEAYALMAKMAEELGLAKALHNTYWRGSTRKNLAGPALWSHHQKFIVLDAPGPGDRKMLKVFFGGLDLTKGRMDWGAHPITKSQIHLGQIKGPDGKVWRFGKKGLEYDDWYNGEFNHNRELPREPWHDIHAALEGPIAWDFTREFVGRWLTKAGGTVMPDGSADASVSAVRDRFLKLMDRKKYVQQWEPRDPEESPWTGQLLHSMQSLHMEKTLENPAWHAKRSEFTWRVTDPDPAFETSIQKSYLHAIAAARDFIYIENQYFIGSEAGGEWKRIVNRIPFALADRIIEKHRAGEPFHVHVVIPMVPEGPTTESATSGTHAVRFIEWLTISAMIRRIKKAVAPSPWTQYLSFYFLAAREGEGPLTKRATVIKDKTTPGKIFGTNPPDPPVVRAEMVRRNGRYMIYVHSKMMIVDDEFIIIGSANINERSMAGDRDTEIGVAMWPSNQQSMEACKAQLGAFRESLWTEHFGRLPAGWREPHQKNHVDEIHTLARENYMRLRNGDWKSSDHGHIVMFPWDVDESGKLKIPAWAGRTPDGTEPHAYLFDASEENEAWSWMSYLPVPFNVPPLSMVIE